MSIGPNMEQRRALASEPKPLIDSPTAIVDARGLRLRAVRQGHGQLGQLGVAVRLDKPPHTVAPAPIARLADQSRALERGHLTA